VQHGSAIEFPFQLKLQRRPLSNAFATKRDLVPVELAVPIAEACVESLATAICAAVLTEAEHAQRRASALLKSQSDHCAALGVRHSPIAVFA
jgi:hypothetical protein